ncbi:MAG: hypothetical protein IKG27_04835 [Bacilli bacterium]|nr:hypothetical protein [Bacilli bacterium]
MNTKKFGIGVLVFLVLILLVIGVKNMITTSVTGGNLKTVYGAVGGGKENLLADEDFIKILHKKFKINVVNDTWSNGKLIVNDVVREDGTNYDFIFFSDQRFYDYYKLAPNAEKGEAKRYTVEKGSLTLNTPVVIYSWDTVTDALIKEGIVTNKDGVYFITDMNKLLNYILEGKSWKDLGLDLYGKINIDSTDPVTSSPGATYYGLLASIMGGGKVDDENIGEILPKLKEFYKKSGYMNNTPADLFQLYLKTGVGAKPMIVDYEKSIIDFANNDPEGYNSVKDKVRILYPSPTIWNSHCIASLSDNGNIYYNVFENKEVQELAWEKYGFRTGVTGGNYDVSKVIVKGIPQSIDGAVSSLKMNIYEKMIESLKN